MTVLIIPSWYKTDSNPTLGSFFREQAMMLKERGVKVIVADATFQGKGDYSSKRCFKMQCKDDEGLLTYSYVVPALGVGRTQSAGVGIFLMNLRRIYKKIVADGHRVDLIHAHSYLPAGLAAVKLGTEKKIPVVVTEHASDVLTQNLSDKRVNYLQQTVAGAKTFICVSEALKKSVINLVGKYNGIKVVPNAVDKRFVFENKQENKVFSFVSVGNLLQSKRFDLTIKAFAMITREFDNIELKIIGDGVLKEELLLLVKQCGIDKKVRFLGRISREQVAVELQDSNVFVLPSDFETFGVVYVEAMACGLPVIATRNGGAEDIIGESSGILVDRDSINQLASAMRKMYVDYSYYDMGEIARMCQKRFGQEKVTSILMNEYEAICGLANGYKN